MNSWTRVRRCVFQGLVHLIAFHCHVTSVTSVLPLLTAKFQRVTSPSGGSEWCSVDLPSMVVQMTRGDVATTCTLECLKDGCCLMHQFKANSYLCEIFEYIPTNFSTIPNCSSQRITMRNDQPAVTQQDITSMLANPRYVGMDNSFFQCFVLRPLYYIVSVMNNKTIDIGGGGGNTGDPIVMMPLQPGKTSQQWYFDAQGYIRSAVNNYGLEKINSNYACPNGAFQQLGVKPFSGSSTQNWLLNGTFKNTTVYNAITNRRMNICNSSQVDGAGIIQYLSPNGGGINNYWSFVAA